MSRFGTLLNLVFLCGNLTPLSSGVQAPCGGNQWQCLDGTCILLIGRCDSYPDCTDGSDERRCSFDVCSESRRKCSSGECVDVYKFCDGVRDCLDASDELAADCQAKNSVSAPDIVPITAMNTTQRVTSPPATMLAPAPVVPFHVAAKPIPIPMPPIDSNNPVDPNQLNKDSSAITLYNAPLFSNRNVDSFPTAVDQYQPTTTKNPCGPNDEIYEFCRRLYRGYFRHPSDCSKYIVCEWGFMYVCKCPEKTYWDVRHLTCVWDYMVPCDNGPVPPIVRIEQTTRHFLAAQRASTTATTPANLEPTITPYMVPQQVRLRASLPVTPAWLKKLSDKSVQMNRNQAPQYKALLTRFFKAVPMEDINKPSKELLRMMK